MNIYNSFNLKFFFLNFDGFKYIWLLEDYVKKQRINKMIIDLSTSS